MKVNASNMNQQGDGGKLYEERILRKQMAVLFVFLLVRLMVMVYLPLSDPSECRYGNMAANMVKTGNFIEPQFIHDGEMQCFTGKPPLFFQTSALCSEVLGENAFAVRLPSFICALLTVWMVFSAVRKSATRKSAWAAAMLCFLSPLFYIFFWIVSDRHDADGLHRGWHSLLRKFFGCPVWRKHQVA